MTMSSKRGKSELESEASPVKRGCALYRILQMVAERVAEKLQQHSRTEVCGKEPIGDGKRSRH